MGGGQAKANYNVEVFSASNAEKYELLGDPRDWLLRVETEFCCICKGTFVLFNVPLGLKDLVVKLMGLHEILVTEYPRYYYLFQIASKIKL